jgi:hypothetical protein
MVNGRPKFYQALVECGTAFGAIGRASVTIDNEHFVCQRITHEIVGADDENLFQDGQYLLEFRDDFRRYTSTPMPPDTIFGSVRHGIFIPLPKELEYIGNRTLSFDITNQLDRSAYGPTFKVAFILCGYVLDPSNN